MDTAPNKKRHATEPAEEANTDQADYVKTTYMGKKAGSSADQPIGEQPKAKGKGKGKVKGKDNQKHTDTSDLRPIIELQRRACIRLLQQQRETARETQLIIEIPDTATELRQQLAATYQQWKTTKPANGRHPKGEMHHVLWRCFINSCQTHISTTYEAHTTEQKIEIKKLDKLMDDSFSITNGYNVVVFHPLGRRDKQPIGTWYWSLKFNQGLANGRTCHEDWLAATYFRPFNIAIRPDRGSIDSIERELRDFNLSSTQQHNS